MKILTAILTCSATQKRANACLETWVKDIKPPHEYYFYGDSLQSKTMNKTWNCTPDEGECRGRLPKKTHKMLKKSLEYDWDFLFKCDDDTYVVHDKLSKLLDKYNPSEDLYIGSAMWGKGFKYAQGGAGYILTRTAVIKCIKSLKNHKNAEDYSVGKALSEEGVNLSEFQLLSTPNPNAAKKDQRICVNSIVNFGRITTHYVKPITMSLIYESMK